MKAIFSRKLLIAIILIAALLRFYKLSSLPALNADEAAIGYNAYSLIQTGKDEHGNSWPIHFQSFNDFKPGLYFYLVAPFIAVLGLSEIAVRFPSALLGVGTVLLIWMLVRELFPKNKWFPYVSALFLAISPWNLHYSRGGWEANAATFFIVLGITAFIKSLTNHKWRFVWPIAFVASLYTYHSARIITPLIVLSMLLIYKKEFFNRIKYLILPILVGGLTLFPLIIDLFGPAGVSRAAGVGLFADTGPFWRINEQRGEHEFLDSKVSRVLHNKATNYGLAFFQNYTEHFWGEFLFLSGDEIQRNKVPETGQMHVHDLLFIAVGLTLIARRPRGWGLVLLWLMISPLAAALTFQSPHALRAQIMAIPLVIISAYGAISIAENLKRKIKIQKLFVVCCMLFVVVIAWGFARYLHEYYSHMAKTYDYSSQYGVKELVSYVTKNQEKYPKIVVTDRYDQPYILFLFYSKYSPAAFQTDHTLTERDQFGFSTVRKFGKYEFRSVDPWNQTRQEFPGALIAGTEKEIPDGTNVLKTIYFPSGRIAFKVVGN